MNRSARCSFFLMAALPLALGLSGCVPNRAYREMPPVRQAPAPAPGDLALCPDMPVPSSEAATAAPGSTKGAREEGPVLHEQVKDKDKDTVYKYSLAFVEFDDLGEMFTRPSETCKDQRGNHDYTELGQTLTEIARLNGGAEGPSPVFVLFIHGWKNNASESSGNVWGFRSVLQSLARDYPGRAIMGIYIGWRGAATNLPVVKEFSFWNRRDAATRIPGAHLTEALRRITFAAKSNPKARCVIVGHSFGGLVLERTLTQAMVEMILEHDAYIKQIDQDVREGKIEQETADREKKYVDDLLQRKRPDLTVLLNEAGPATEAKEFLNFLIDQEIDFIDIANNQRYPLFLSLTSSGDAATHIVFPIGQFLGKRGVNTRIYEGKDEFGETDQNNYFLHTTANSPRLVNHSVFSEKSVPSLCKDSPNRYFDLGEKPNKTRYFICNDDSPDDRIHKIKTTIPYWVMQIPTEFVPDHSTVFKPELRALLQAFITPIIASPAAPRVVPGVPEPVAPDLKLQHREKPESRSADQKPGS